MILLDTDFLFSFFDSSQSTHEASKKVVEKYGNQEFYLSNLVKQELATVISHKVGYKECQIIITAINGLEVKNIYVDEIQTVQIWELFNTFHKKQISFVDCSNLYLAKKLGYKIASFDKFYPKNILAN
jgi:predicted nucleic acid-binding protein